MFSNQLANETSPYLLQHASNPVHWQPWRQQALDQARDENKPIFLSIGYSACHWCHVMEHESFEDEETAAFLNKHFVSIKVDREERPDLDQIYMHAVQLLTRQGGWPLNVFLTPNLEPFFGGTYWPPMPRFNRPSFLEVLQAVSGVWTNDRNKALETASQLTAHLQATGGGAMEGSETILDHELAQTALSRLGASFDPEHGGFGSAPKFPHAMDVQLLLRHTITAKPNVAAKLRHMAETTLIKMANGGIYDHVGGGFARYSVDDRWLVPHFEKMLYDNALLTGAYLDAFLVTGESHYRETVDHLLEYILRDMQDDCGGYHSSEDADSEGEEGKFYVWTGEELQQALGNELAKKVAAAYGVTPSGNFEGANILYLPQTLEQTAEQQGWDGGALREEMKAALKQLYAIRQQRVRPGKDDKILASWNALMIDSMARAGAALRNDQYVESARRAALFILGEMRGEDGRLRHCWRQGRALEMAFLEDYAAMIVALLSLYEATWDESFIDRAVELADVMMDQYHDTKHGGFFFTANDHESLIARNKDIQDSSMPSGNALAATGLLRLGKMCGRSDWLDAAHATLVASSETMERTPMTGQLFIALDMLLGEFNELVVLSTHEHVETVSHALRSSYGGRRVTMLRVDDDDMQYRSRHLDAAFEGKSCQEGVSIYVCSDFSCQAPAVGLQASLDTMKSTAEAIQS